MRGCSQKPLPPSWIWPQSSAAVVVEKRITGVILKEKKHKTHQRCEQGVQKADLMCERKNVMLKWFQKLKGADRATKLFYMTLILYSAAVVLPNLYCYLRLDFVRSYDAATYQKQK